MKIPEYDSASSLASSDLFIVETSSGTKKVSEEVLKNTVNSGMQEKLTFDNTPTEGSSNPVKSGGVYSAVNGKVDKVTGKGLSTNDYTTEEKNKLAGLSNYDDTEVRGLINGKQDKINGGTTGQVLKKKSNTDLDFEWGDETGGSGVPAGGTTGQVLRKHSNTDQDVEWSDIPEVPNGGTTGQVLTKHSNQDGDFEWASPAGTGDMLKSVYDTDDDGKVDAAENADTVSGFTVGVSVPADAVFTDTVYDDTELRSLVAGKVSTTSVGAAGGVASLDANGKVPSSELPSYVDDVLNGYYNNVTDKFYEDASFTTEIPAETGKIYVDLYTEKTYRWSGSVYIEISESLALGETSSTAYAGNKGKANADAIAAIKDGTTIDSFGDVETALSGKADSSSLSDYIAKSSTAGLMKNDGTVDTTQYLSQHQDISGKADKVSGATSGNFAGLDSNGNLTDSGSKASDFLTSHQDISGKADKVQSATSGNFAGLDSNGNLTDSGHKHSDYLTSHQDISGKADLTVIAPSFSTSTAYTSGAYVTYEGELYKFTSDHAAGDWDLSEVTLVTCSTEFGSGGGGGSVPTGTSGQALRFNAQNELVAENVATNAVENSALLITSGGVYSAIDSAIGAALQASY